MSVAASPAPFSLAQGWRSFGWLLVGRIFRAVLSVAVGAWVARHLGPHDFGRLNAVLAIVLILTSVTGLGLDTIVRQHLARTPAEAGAVLGTCLGLRALAGTFAWLALLALTGWIGHSGDALLWTLLGALLVLQVPLSLDFWYQARLRQRVTALAQSCAFVITSIGRVIAILLHAPVEVFAALIIIDAPIAAAWLWRTYRRERSDAPPLHWDGALVRPWLRLAGPLWLGAIAATALAHTNQALLLRVNVAEAGLFAAAHRVFDLVVFVPIALVTTFSPVIAHASRGDAGRYRRMKQHAFAAVAAISWLAAAALLLGAGFISEVLFGPEFRGSAAPLRWLAIGLVLHGLLAMQTEAWAAQAWTRRLLVAAIIAAGVNLALALWWLPEYGATGAAAARVVAVAIATLGVTWWWRDARADAADLLRAAFGWSWWKSRRAPSLDQS